MGEVHDASTSSFPSTTHTIPSTLVNKIIFDPILGAKNSNTTIVKYFVERLRDFEVNCS